MRVHPIFALKSDWLSVKYPYLPACGRIKYEGKKRPICISTWMPIVSAVGEKQIKMKAKQEPAQPNVYPALANTHPDRQAHKHTRSLLSVRLPAEVFVCRGNGI